MKRGVQFVHALLVLVPPVLGGCEWRLGKLLCGEVTTGAVICENTCGKNGSGAFDLTCDDGGPGAYFSLCGYGTDCGDCGRRAVRDGTTASPPPAALAPPPAPQLAWKLNKLVHAEVDRSLIDMVVDVLSLLLLAFVVVPLLCLRLVSRRMPRYDRLAVGGSSSLELGSVSHSSAGLPSSLSDGALSDADAQPQPAVVNQQLVDTQRQMLVLLSDLTAEVRALQTHNSNRAAPPDASEV